ncbi:unnamed protein product [Macrosiphum euphorbiae]|uniref:Uncharacterized protein n=1 Tax=Macrosiphum euphorbiae TaxID=13131 RepID=A0AAV0VPE0_9HEMI|nr:unnamed protein product [Macrosiphum euphorbiae]
MSTEHYTFNNDDRFSYFSVTTDNISYSYTNILICSCCDWRMSDFGDFITMADLVELLVPYSAGACPPISAMPCTAGNPTG